MQLFYCTLVNGTFTLEKLDRWFSSLDDIRSLFCVTTYWRHPCLTLMAITAWYETLTVGQGGLSVDAVHRLLPLAAIFSPAALSISFDEIQPNPFQSVHVPQPAFDSLAFWSPTPKNGLNPNTTSGLQYRSPSENTQRIIRAVAAGGEILPITPPGTNASWTSVLELPRLSCAPLDSSAKKAVENNISQAILETGEDFNFNPDSGSYLTRTLFAYMSWMKYNVGIEGHSYNVPFPQPDENQTYSMNVQDFLNGQKSYNGLDSFFGVVPRASNYTVPDRYSFWDTKNNTAPQWNPLEPGQKWGSEAEESFTWRNLSRTYLDNYLFLFKWYMEDAVFLRYQLAAAKYTLDFSYSNQAQRIHISSVEEASLVPSTSMFRFEVDGNETLLLDTCQTWCTSQSRSPVPMRAHSYMAIYQAFMSLLVGAYQYHSGHLGTARFSGGPYSTDVFSTSLIESIELSKLALWQPSAANISNATSGAAYDDATSLYAPARTEPGSRKPLEEMLEELFFNVTISMASSEALLYNHSSPFAPPPQNVTFHVHGNIYTYDAYKLWIPYGIALVVSLLNVICGLGAMLSVGASFTADFSSVARIARNADFGADLREDLAGKDPLPKYMAQATLDLHGDQELSIGEPELIVQEVRPDKAWVHSRE
ncbi:hypothetical protein CBER1_01031 [Cercospora berteroae]|uniref:Uncharacterized protein n=1 Tax=Cercospora berteroae TaxID=357750 RepID=A0A2S6C345_9PEZI|nr:hypothetical protein CBER1_01031 [Cercospora berteroae]